MILTKRNKASLHKKQRKKNIEKRDDVNVRGSNVLNPQARKNKVEYNSKQIEKKSSIPLLTKQHRLS